MRRGLGDCARGTRTEKERSEAEPSGGACDAKWMCMLSRCILLKKSLRLPLVFAPFPTARFMHQQSPAAAAAARAAALRCVARHSTCGENLKG
jgi:hypothetical protein